jgi:selenide,water dikinase
VGIERVDDAGVYKISEELALIHTIDFFTPIVDDPYAFGQIAAANALSDVYAMGGRPLTAMNVVCFPSKEMDISVLREILRGGLDKMKQAGCVLVGGHSVEDSELKYGLAVVGTIHPDRVVKNQGARPNDRIVLTKPLGTGVVATAIKAGLAKERTIRQAIETMACLNGAASEAMVKVGVNAATDITGFGLLGHASEMIDGTDVGMEIYAGAIPFLPQAEEFARLGLIPAGTYRNREFRHSMVDVSEDVPGHIVDLLFDPQTSGGLLISVPEEKASSLLEELRRRGVTWARPIGRVTSLHPGTIRVLK